MFKEWFFEQIDFSLDVVVKGMRFLEIGGFSVDGELLQFFLVINIKEK